MSAISPSAGQSRQLELVLSTVLPLAFIAWLEVAKMGLAGKSIPAGIRSRRPPSDFEAQISDKIFAGLKANGYEAVGAEELSVECPEFRFTRGSSKIATVENLLFGSDIFRSRS